MADRGIFKRGMSQRRKARESKKPVTVSKVKSIVNATEEMKRFTQSTGYNAVTFAQTPVVNNLYIPIQGSAQGQRIGTKVRVKRIDFQMCLQGNGTDNAGSARVLIIRDDMNNGGNGITTLDLFSNGTNADAPNWLFNINNIKRFKVIFDRVFDLNAQIATQLIKKHFRITKRYKNGVLTRFNNTNGATNADIIQGAYYLLTQCNNSVNTPTGGFVINVDYVDA